MLTRKQHELLFFLHQYIKKSGISPSFDEMKKALNLSSKSGICRLITGLEERGFIRRMPNRARAVEIIRLPRLGFITQDSGSATEEKSITQKNIKKINYLNIPIMGKITANTSVSSIRKQTGSLYIAENSVKKEEYYALEMKDNSMSEAGILDGDILIILRTCIVESGEIVIAIINNNEAMIKKYQYRKNLVTLESANPDYKARVLEIKNIEIQGKLTCLIRHYA